MHEETLTLFSRHRWEFNRAYFETRLNSHRFSSIWLKFIEKKKKKLRTLNSSIYCFLIFVFGVENKRTDDLKKKKNEGNVEIKKKKKIHTRKKKKKIFKAAMKIFN